MVLSPFFQMRYLKRVPANRFALRHSTIFILVLFYFPLAAQGAEKRATIQGVSHANLRTGPGVSHPANTILNVNDQLIIEGKEGEWYFVTALNGQKGYVHQSLVRVISGESVPATRDDVVATKPAVGEAQPLPKLAPVALSAAPTALSPATLEPALQDSEPLGVKAETKTSQAPVIADANDSRTVQTKSPPLIQLLEGREADIVLWLAIAVAFFLIGWICGGNYYLRRDRLRRTRLRF